MLVISAVIFAAPANAQFAQDNVSSDAYGNTAAGTAALYTMTPSAESSLGCNLGPSCNSNTAIGNNAMHFNTTGSVNTASGAGALYMNATGAQNTAMGVNALYNNLTNYNTAVGYDALADNLNGQSNTAVGNEALAENQTGVENTAVGAQALYSNRAGAYNSALGAVALSSNTTGGYNTATGGYALFYNLTGSNNTAAGSSALQSNTTGSRNNAAGSNAMFNNTSADDNNAMGYGALYSNMTGTLNNAVGNFSLYYNTTGNNNSGVGYAALYHNTTGSSNNAQGFYAMQSNTSGNNNIALGEYAGYNLTTGSSNIDIGNRGVAGESSVIRIGTGAAATYISGISNAKVTGSAVYVTAAGQLGALASSERYKTAIASMGAGSAKLDQLRPVTFRLKTDPQRVLQYGLIAEEVAKVYPELVLSDAAGNIEGVRYEELAPMLLNEVQRQRHAMTSQDQKLAALGEQLRQMQRQFDALKDVNAATQAALLKLQERGGLVATR
jgi:hypothetical protein